MKISKVICDHCGCEITEEAQRLYLLDSLIAEGIMQNLVEDLELCPSCRDLFVYTAQHFKDEYARKGGGNG